MNNPRIVVSFPREHQEILIEGLKLVEARLESLAQSWRFGFTHESLP